MLWRRRLGSDAWLQLRPVEDKQLAAAVERLLRARPREAAPEPDRGIGLLAGLQSGEKGALIVSQTFTWSLQQLMDALVACRTPADGLNHHEVR